MRQPARRFFRVLTRTRCGYDGAVMYDVQLAAVSSGRLLWSQTFTDADEAQTYERRLDVDLDRMDDEDFRRTYSIPSGA